MWVLWLDMVIPASKLVRAPVRTSGYSELSISHCEVVGPGSQLLRHATFWFGSLGWCKLKEVEQSNLFTRCVVKAFPVDTKIMKRSFGSWDTVVTE